MTTLLDSHLHHLTQGSGILEAVIAERGYSSVEGKAGTATLRTLRFPRRQALNVPGLVLPVHTTDGQQPLAVYRPDHPDLAPDGRARKYLLPKDAGIRIDCPPRCLPQLADPSIALWVTEGQKKGDSLASVGATAIALLGVWGIKGKNAFGGTTVLADLDHIAFDHRTVHIVFDSDVMVKLEVGYALERLVEHLTRKGAAVDAIYLPTGSTGKTGVDDFLVQGHILADLEALAEAPRPLQRRLPAVRAIPTLQLTKAGIPYACVVNIAEVLTKDPQWQGVFGYDQLLAADVLVRRPPYLADQGTWTPRPIEDRDDTETAIWIEREYELRASTSLVAESVHALCGRQPFHSIRTYLTSLQWDGTQRLNTWLSTYCKAPDTRFNRAVGAKTLISAVARVMEPGCKADCVTIFQGPQGTYKSTVWRILAGDDWFSDTLTDIHTKDAAQGLRGKWIVEFGELATLRRSELEAVKRFVSATQDHYRPSYGRRAETFPRQNIFVGTTNREVIFTDETGDRRYWPVSVGDKCDIEALKRDRDQLWAEAFVRYKSGVRWYLSAKEEDLANAERDARFEEDVWDEPITDFLANKTFVTTQQLLVECLGMAELAHQNVVHSRRVGAVLRRHGWDGNCVTWETINGVSKRVKGWRKRGAPDDPHPPSGDEKKEEAKTPDPAPDIGNAEEVLLPMLPISVSIGSRNNSCKNNHATDATDATDTFHIGKENNGKSVKVVYTSEPEIPKNQFATSSIGYIENIGDSGSIGSTGSNGALASPVTIQPSRALPPMTTITTASELEAILPSLLQEPRLGLDTETTGLQWHTDRLRLVQLATPTQVVLIDAFQCPLAPLRPLLQSDVEFVGHNLKFDLHMLHAAGLPLPTTVLDTMVLAQLLGASATGLSKPSYALKDVVARALGRSMDKTLQTSDWSGTLASEQLAYAAHDAMVLLPLAAALSQQIADADMTKIARIEQACVPAMVWMEAAGMPLAVEPWVALADAAQTELATFEGTLARLVQESGYAKPIPYTKTGKVPKRFNPAINWNAWQQVVPFLQFRGHQVESIKRDVLEMLRTDDPVVTTYLQRIEWVERTKRASWVEKYCRDGRVYAQFHQLGSLAGRMSCSEPNLQSIPRTADYRRCFRAPDGCCLLKADYGQIELRIAAVLAQEQTMLDAFSRGEDLHRKTAAQVLGIAPDAVSSEQRHIAKTVNFGLIYGLSPESLRTKVWADAHIDLTLIEAHAFRDTFFLLYPAFKRWHAGMKRAITLEGSIETRTLTNRRRLGIRVFTEAANSPTQGSAADGFKLALARLWRDRAACPNARVIGAVHDELIVEVPRAEAEAAQAWVKRHMEAAMAYVVKDKVPIVADVAIGQDWAGTPLA